MVDDIEARDAVLDAYREARAAGLEAGECYRAGVQAWMELHPDHHKAAAAKRAVEILQKSFGTLQDMARP